MIINPQGWEKEKGDNSRWEIQHTFLKKVEKRVTYLCGMDGVIIKCT